MDQNIIPSLREWYTVYLCINTCTMLVQTISFLLHKELVWMIKVCGYVLAIFRMAVKFWNNLSFRFRLFISKLKHILIACLRHLHFTTHTIIFSLLAYYVLICDYNSTSISFVRLVTYFHNASSSCRNVFEMIVVHSAYVYVMQISRTITIYHVYTVSSPSMVMYTFVCTYWS
jgi:hypothetical protein